MPLGLATGELIGLTREARRLDEAPGCLLVLGPLADVLARALAEDAADPTLVRTAGDPGYAVAVVVVLAGAAGDDDVRVLREATRAHVPVVAVQMQETSAEIPYVLAEHVVDCLPGEGFPVERVAEVLASALGRDAVPLAARLPVLRDAVRARRFRRAVVQSAIVSAAPWSDSAHFPLLVMGNTRMLMELEAASGRAPADDVRATGLAAGLPVATALAAGVVARTVYRRLPVGGPLTAGAIAVLGTVAVRALGDAIATRR
jgi:hypothetical protein